MSLTKRILIFVTVFLFISAMGLVVALAGGLSWGTEEAGKQAASTLVFATFFGAMFASFPYRPRNG